MMKRYVVRSLVWLGRLILVLLFLAVASFVVLEGRGFRFNQKTLRFERTGAIILRFSPEDANLLINGKTVEEKSPVVLEDLLPGRYELELRKDRYQSWRKTVGLEAERVVAEINILLFREEPVIETIVNEGELVQLRSLLKQPTSLRGPQVVNGNEIWLGDRLVTRLSQPVVFTAWLVEDDYLLFQVDQELRVVAADGTNDRPLLKLTTAQPTTATAQRRGAELIYQDGEKIKRATLR